MPLSTNDIIRIIGKHRPETIEEHTRLVEYRMGMSVDDFHRKKNRILTRDYIGEAEENRRILNEWINQGNNITTWKKENRQVLALAADEQFIPCFSPDESVRNELPVYWFLSNHGNLVTIKRRHVYWIQPYPYDDGPRTCYKWENPVTDKKSSIMTYEIGRLIFNKDAVVGLAKDYIERFGSYCYGPKGDPFNVETHHESRLEHYPESVNDPFACQAITVRLHDILQRIRKKQDDIRITDDPVKKENKEAELAILLTEFAQISKIEIPGKIVRMNAGNQFDNRGIYGFRILSEEEAPHSKEQRQQLRNVADLARAAEIGEQ